MLANIPDYNQRISAGKSVEEKILNALRQRGYKIENPSEQEDKYEKIDGWWIGKNGGRFPLQVKFRESGDDILFELVKDMDKGISGRDPISKSVIYLVVNRTGDARMYLTKPIKKKAQQIVAIIYDELKKNPSKTLWSGDKWEARIQYDRAHGQRKLVAYFHPALFDALVEWKLNLHEEHPHGQFDPRIFGPTSKI